MNSLKSKVTDIEKGFCYLIDMNPGRRSKPGKIRPALVIQSSDTIRAGSPGIVTIPLTSQLQEENILRVRLLASEYSFLEKDSDVLIDQIHTVDRSLFIRELGLLHTKDLKKISSGIHFLLV